MQRSAYELQCIIASLSPMLARQSLLLLSTPQETGTNAIHERYDYRRSHTSKSRS